MMYIAFSMQIQHALPALLLLSATSTIMTVILTYFFSLTVLNLIGRVNDTSTHFKVHWKRLYSCLSNGAVIADHAGQ